MTTIRAVPTGRWARRAFVLVLLIATLAVLAVLGAGTVVSAAEPGSITIKKVCPPGFTGLAQFEVSKVLDAGVETAAAGFNIECGSSLRVSSIPADGGTPPTPLFIGDKVHVVEVRPPTGLAGLGSTIVTLTDQSTLEVDNAAALSFHKVCAAGVSGSANSSTAPRRTPAGRWCSTGKAST